MNAPVRFMSSPFSVLLLAVVVDWCDPKADRSFHARLEADRASLRIRFGIIDVGSILVVLAPKLGRVLSIFLKHSGHIP